MKIILFILLLFPTLVFAEVNEKYSFKDFTDKSLIDVSVTELNNTEIVGSCFYQQIPEDYAKSVIDIQVFPSGMTGVIFRRCNLDNVKMPPGNIIINKGWEKCSTKNIKTQKDGETWYVDNQGDPIAPTSPDIYDELGISKDPKDLPTKKTKAITVTKQKELILSI